MLVPDLGQFIWARGCNESVSSVLANQTTLIAVGVVGVVFGLVEVRLGIALSTSTELDNVSSKGGTDLGRGEAN